MNELRSKLERAGSNSREHHAVEILLLNSKHAPIGLPPSFTKWLAPAQKEIFRRSTNMVLKPTFAVPESPKPHKVRGTSRPA